MSVSDVAVDVLVVGAGPSGSAAAIYAREAGLEVLLLEADSLGRDKTCGDGLTPRAVHQLERMGLAEPITSRYYNLGLKLNGYGGSVTATWPDSAYGRVGSAMPRTQFDEYLAQAAVDKGAKLWENSTATDPDVSDGRIRSVRVGDTVIRPKWVIVADGVRSTFGKQLGRKWHQGEVYGIAARSYLTSTRSEDPWMHSHVELRNEHDEILPGYGWIFPLGDGTVNLGCGALSTSDRPARLNTKKLLTHYANTQRTAWNLGTPQRVTSAMLPMGGAVSNVAGKNWAIIGDAAAGVNPLNGEGIDYGLEMAELAITLLDSGDLRGWPALLRDHYGEAFMLARTAARLLTYPKFLPAVGPLALRGPVGAKLMPAAARLMANLITEEDKDLLARLWRVAGRGVSKARANSPLWS